jgi:hypothetical protein
MRSGGTCPSLTGSGEKRVGEGLDFFKDRRRWRMRTYWPIMWERLKALYEAGVRGLEADVAYQPNGERRVRWAAWGPDGLPADWRELGLEKVLDETVYELMWEDDGLTRLYFYPNGCKIERQLLGERRWQVEVRGEVGEDVLPHYFSWRRPLRERLGYLLARYPNWYRYEAPRAWREQHGPRPTLEALLAWGKERGEWSLLEEPLVPALLREALEGR